MYLIDTNVILELLLEQKKADQVEYFLRKAKLGALHLSEFSLYSLGVILFIRKMHELFLRVINDFLVMGGVRILHLGIDDIQEVGVASRTFNLDFDDAYQYKVQFNNCKFRQRL